VNRPPGRNQADRWEISVREHYDSSSHLEADRLRLRSPVEFEVTKKCLERWLPAYGSAADIGVGAGHYAEFLARKKWSIHLADISQRFLDVSCARLSSENLNSKILSVSCCSGTDLNAIATGSCDAVLLLGPLYHLPTIELRRKAVSEAARILKTGGVLFAAGINRLAYFRDLLSRNPFAATDREEFHRQFLADGNLDPIHAPLIGLAHLTTVAEFRHLFCAAFRELALVGVESFSGGWQENLVEMDPREREAWLALVEQTAFTPEGLGASDHFLYVGYRI
jgi:SAM-dependent methyltransferase